MPDEPAAEATSWKQWKLPQLNLGTLVSVLIAVGFITWQGLMIRAQIDDNSQAVGSMAYAVEELAGAVSLDVWIEISTLSERIDAARNDSDSLRGDVESTWHQQNELRIEMVERVAEFDLASTTLSDLEWRVDDLDRRVAEAFGAEMAGGDDDYAWQITDLTTRLAELTGRVNAGGDLEWQIDDLTRQLTDLRIRVETSGGVEQWEIDDLYGVTDELFDMVWRMWAALESRSWPAEYLYD